MEQLNIGLDQLLKETLFLANEMGKEVTETLPMNGHDLNQVVNSEYFLESEEDEDFLEVEQAISQSPQPIPAAPGIIFRIERGQNTYCLRGFVSSQLAESFDYVKSGKTDLLASLKMNDLSLIEEVHFFETPSFEIAESIKDEMFNRRFPIEEDVLCNLSDPGYTWWFQETENKLFIYFRAQSIDRQNRYTKLGPIGDVKIAEKRLREASVILRNSIPLSEFTCNEKQFMIATTRPDHPSFEHFKNIFLKGENFTRPENFPDSAIGRTLYFYFQELAWARQFWIQIESMLKN